jgi:hypothetical protein
MTEVKTSNSKELTSINKKGFYSDKSETPKEVLKLSEKLKNLDPKSDVKTKEVIENADKYEIVLKKKSTKNNVDHWVETGDNKKAFHFGRLPIYVYVARSLGLSENDKIKVIIEGT